MLLKDKDTTLEATGMLNAFVLFGEEGMEAAMDTFPEYKDFVTEHQEWSVRQVKNEIFPPQKLVPKG